MVQSQSKIISSWQIDRSESLATFTFLARPPSENLHALPRPGLTSPQTRSCRRREVSP